MQNSPSFYIFDSKTVLEKLGTNPSGLSNKQVVERQKKYGKNIFNQQRKNGLLSTFFSQFLSPLIFILIFASCITFYLGEVVETIVILLAILINVFFSTYQEYKAESTIEHLKTYIKNRAIVKREGLIKEIDAEELSIGDIVVLQYGSRVPADVRLIESIGLEVDESILTGESLPVSKENTIVTSQLVSERANYGFCGTLVTNGNGIGVVTSIGQNTEIGKIAESINDTRKVLTPVQNAIKNASWYIFLIAIIIVTFIFFLGIYKGQNFFEMLVLASAVAVGAVPEALPIALTVILSIGVLNISKRGGLIRKLDAAETLGSTTLVLTDKTGTLTEGKLNLENILTASDLLSNNIAPFNAQNLTDSQTKVLLEASKNISATVMDDSKDKSKWKYSGDSFEVIILKTLVSIGAKYEKKSKILLPFNSTNKYSISESNGYSTVLGAPDILIKNSGLDIVDKEKLLLHIHSLSEKGIRLVAVAEKKANSSPTSISGLNILGFFLFSDKLRKNIRQSILEIESKGVKVKIISGDLRGTARYIAQEVGLKVDDDQVLTGSEMADLNDTALLKILPNMKVFARVTPEDKLRIGKLYQQLGEVVAMTGDGVNDSPSLKAMDIGISLSSGSEVAKSASDMILLRNNFKTIVDTITEGHNIKSNIQKVFVYLMSNSLDEVFVVTGSLLAGLALPLTALQIIWVNILTGTLPALAFAYDKNHSATRTSGEILDFKVKFLALGIGTFSSLLLFILYYILSVNILEARLAQSIFFLCFATYILVVAFSFKNLNKYIWQYNPFSNSVLNLATLIGVVFIFLSVYTELGQKVFQLDPVPLYYLWILCFWLVVNVLVVEASKFFLTVFSR